MPKSKVAEPQAESKKKADSLNIKNLYVNFLYGALDVPLHGEERRARTKFAEIVRAKLQEIEDARIDLLKQYAEKNDKGELIIKEDKNYDLSQENLEKFNEEYRKYLDEMWVIDILPSNKVNLKMIRDIMKKSNKQYQTAEGEIFDRLLDEFEKI